MMFASSFAGKGGYLYFVINKQVGLVSLASIHAAFAFAVQLGGAHV
jgi:hypothetical protein